MRRQLLPSGVEVQSTANLVHLCDEDLESLLGWYLVARVKDAEDDVLAERLKAELDRRG